MTTPKSKYEPPFIIKTKGVDVEAVLKYFKLEYKIDKMDESLFKCEIAEIAPMEIPEGLTEWIEFSFRVKK